MVAGIIADVGKRGDAALAEYTRLFDGFDPTALDWRISKEECCMALDGLDAELREALALAASRIRAFHEGQLPGNSESIDENGVRAGVRWSPVDRAGIYVPGGRAAYPSSLLMNAIPALVAGVERLVMVTPTPGGTVNPLVLAAAEIAALVFQHHHFHHHSSSSIITFFIY